MFDLSGKTALVTGATGGIGGSIARALHAQGATVALSGTRENVLSDLASELGSRAFVVAANLGDAAQVDELPKRAEEAMGGLDILINNAGITRDTLMMRMKDDDFNEVIRINLEAGFRLMRASLKGMIKRRYGRMISIVSVVGQTGNPGQVNYAASKAGTIGMSKSLAYEVASRGITVNCIAPGFIATAMTEGLAESHGDAITGRIPLGRMGKPEEIAAAAVFLASEEAAYITGQTISVNGGLAMLG